MDRTSRFALFEILFAISSLFANDAYAQLEFENAPINYATDKPTDPVARLQKKIDDGSVQLRFDGDHGYLPSVLKAFDISTESQLLVFSKTSLQIRRISPRTPRALYYNDDVYVGWIPNTDMLEISAVDPALGAVFYTLPQQESDKPSFVRDKGNCLSCHASGRTYGVPGHLVRSVYPNSNGLPHFGLGTYRTNHSSSLKRRWGGWFVTGTHGDHRHMGNAISLDQDEPKMDTEAGANVTSLEDRTQIDRYLTKHSDIVSLLVLDHQTDMHNFITLANFQTRMAQHHGAIINKALDRPLDFVSESTQRRIKNASEKLVKYLLFVDEAKLSGPIAGTSKFANEFAQLGPFDKQGRSLRQFDLKTRLFKYPCSFLIYSEAFRKMPTPAKEYVYRRLWEILNDIDNKDETFAHLTKLDRKNIREILVATIDELPDYWKK